MMENGSSKDQNSYYRVLSPGRVLADHGPVTMVIQAGLRGEPHTGAALAGARLVPDLLKGLVEYLSYARQEVGNLDPGKDQIYPEVLIRMAGAVRQLDESDFTPMAAVAGTFSDLVKEAVVAAGADRVVVNNGGDISLYLAGDDSPFRVGIISDLEKGEVTHATYIRPDMGIGGIATSGLGGRSLTKGVASAVTVLAKSSCLADAAATSVANAANCLHPAVERCPAQELDHLTDIPGHLVTRRLGDLPDSAVEEALAGGLERARQLHRRGMISGAVIFVRGRAVMWPENIVLPLT